ncbi:MAG: DUF2306 domain-containing protein [Candidatus Dormibacter sp.]|uniref:DUF2306 domain-containing protein n=1 Tax=Candidatus Dormibacter sp. TaxID=2973982 RepID=UPI000DB67C9D|nr:MAG: hypothetical protein DLM66_06300 [Candidatus Dormibacteraeota bacterium]
MKHRKLWLTMTILALMTAAASARYFSLNPQVFMTQQRLTYMANLTPLLLHITGGTVALTTGPFQFLTGLRGPHRTLHRWLGRVYLLGALAAGVGGLLMARIAFGGPVARIGFAVLALEMLGATALALRAILRRRIPAHREWMTRSYALIFVAVTFRLFLIPTALGAPFALVYAADAWLSTIVNLLVAEALIRRARRPRTSGARPLTGSTESAPAGRRTISSPTSAS